MECEKCGVSHEGSYGSGRFCSAKCARSFSTSKVLKGTFKKALCPKCGIEHIIKNNASEKVTLCIGCGGNPLKPEDPRSMGFTCIYCGDSLKNKNSVFCSKKCFHEYRYLIYINKWKLDLVDGFKPCGYFLSEYVKKYLWKKYNNKCMKCGWDTPNPFINKLILEIDHVDGNSINNKERNLELICPNCHSLTSTYKALNKGKGIKERLKYFKLI